MFLERQGQSEQQTVCAIDAERAVQLMGEFDGFAGVTAMAGQGRQGDGTRTQGDSVIGSDDTPVVQAQATGKIEAARQGAKVGSGVGGGTGEALL